MIKTIRKICLLVLVYFVLRLKLNLSKIRRACVLSSPQSHHTSSCEAVPHIYTNYLKIQAFVF